MAATTCGHCGSAVELRFERGTLIDKPGGVVWSPTKACAIVAAEFCPEANLFCDRAHIDAWRSAAGHPAGEVLTLAEAVERIGFVWAELAGR